MGQIFRKRSLEYMIKCWKVKLPDLTGTKKRRAYLYLPEEYKYNRRKHYPVLYMFDGQNVFFDEDATYGKSWGMKNFMDASGAPLIIAAVECDDSPDWGRLSEYSPYDFDAEDTGHITGRAETTMHWFIHWFKPYVDRYYRTIPDRDHTFIAGSSMGGLISMYAVLHHNDIFSRAACLSPTLWAAPEKSKKMIRSAKLAGDTIVYMDYGSEEVNNDPQLMRAFGEMSTLLLGKGIMLESRIVPGGIHSESSWEAQIPFFMNTLMYGLIDL